MTRKTFLLIHILTCALFSYFEISKQDTAAMAALIIMITWIVAPFFVGYFRRGVWYFFFSRDNDWSETL